MPTAPSSEPGNPSILQFRTLGTFERAQLLTSESSPSNLVIALRIEGCLDRGRLRTALDELQLDHPLLAVRLVGKPAAATFELGGVPPIPLQVLRRTKETSWIDAVEAELSTGFERETGPLVRCSFLGPNTGDAGGGHSEIILTFHHVTVDATSASHIIDELLELCGTETAEPVVTYETPSKLPPRADAVFPSRFRGASRVWPSCRFLAREMAGEVAFRWRTRTHRASPHPGPARCRVLPMVFSEADTETLVRASRKRRLTLNSALNAALLLAVVRHRYAGTDLPHRYFVFPTLRPYLDPPLAEEIGGSYLTTMRLTVTTSETRNVWDLAAEIQRQVHKADKRGGRFLAALLSALSMKMILGQSSYRMSTLGLSYTGAQPFKLQHGALSLAEIHAFVSNLPVGPEYTAQARIFRRRLWLDILYLDVDMNEREARTIAEEAWNMLVREVRSGAEGSS